MTENLPSLSTLAAGVHGVIAPLGDRFVTMYLVVGSASALHFDGGTDGMVDEFVLPALTELGLEPPDISHVVMSHCDVDHFVIDLGDTGTEGALAFPVVGHLERLRASGQIRRTQDRAGIPAWTFA
ncbi:MBL fold metallo-hydrolase [Nakamurella antarctica]|uniref:MBL fold metallo-hydrolase n=1 Tax=Nakamurella antarctica TaxID=1902245 RepID=A0A3G8ZIQ4_9ACTN|nr:MBL fold metallo-hydrolase [Nakamurella antarctica]AZI57058.1 MBL fold metallo-hydrolase [Nakamurella antarctica]